MVVLGFDLVAAIKIEKIILESNDTALIPTEASSLQLPKGFEAQVRTFKILG